MGWLEKWKKRFSIKYFKICGESGDVQGVTIDSWKERLPELVRGYSKNDIWNMDETGLFFRALPDHGFAHKSHSCKGGKKSKQRFTIAFFVSASADIKKNLFSSGNQKIRGACVALINLLYLSHTTPK